MKSIILIVIDSLSWKPIKALLPRLPTFSYLINNYKSGSFINNLQGPRDEEHCNGDALVLTSFCSAASVWSGKQPMAHGMIASAWDKCICSPENPSHNKIFKKEELKSKFIWEEIPDAVALHTFLFPMIYYNCERPPYKEFELEDTTVKFPYDPKIRFSFPEKITQLLAKESVRILTERKPPLFTCGLYGLDTMSHYNWHEPDFEDIFRGYKFIDDYLRDILSFMEKGWFMVCTQHGMNDWYITQQRKGSRPQGIKGVHGDHDPDCPFFTNMDEPKEILDIYKIMMKYVKLEGMI